MKMNMTNFGEVCISLHPSFHKPTHQYIKKQHFQGFNKVVS